MVFVYQILITAYLALVPRPHPIYLPESPLSPGKPRGPSGPLDPVAPVRPGDPWGPESPRGPDGPVKPGKGSNVVLDKIQYLFQGQPYNE